MSRIKISLSLIMMLAVLLLGFSSVVQAEDIPKGPNGEELTPGPENASEAELAEDGQTENTISDELSGVSEEPPIPTPENSIMLPDEPIEENTEAVPAAVEVSDSQSGFSSKDNLPFIIIIVVMVLSAGALLVFAFKKFKGRK